MRRFDRNDLAHKKVKALASGPRGFFIRWPKCALSELILALYSVDPNLSPNPFTFQFIREVHDSKFGGKG